MGLISNAIRTDRIGELMAGDGIAIVEKTGVFGGGYLQHFGINSNTAGDGFIRCIMQKEDKTEEGFKSPSPVRTKVVKIGMMNPDKNIKGEVANSKKDLEENKDEQGVTEQNDPVVGGHDSDNELDYEDGKQIDNTQPLKNEQGRAKFKKSVPLPMFKSLFSSDI